MEGAPEVVVEISPYKETCENALHSVLRCSKLLGKRIHIVRAGFDPSKSVLPSTLEALAAARIELVLHGATLKLDNSAPLAVVQMAPELVCYPSAIERLLENMKATHKRHSHFAVSTNLQFDTSNYNWRRPSSWIACAAYGFLNVILMLDVFRSILNLSKYHRTVDLRSQTLTLTWPNSARLTPASKWLWWWRTGISGTNPALDDAVQQVTFQDAGWNLVLRTIYTHAHMGIGLLWMSAFFIYYMLLAYPWWNHFVSTDIWWIKTLLIRDVWNNTPWTMLYLWHYVIVTIVAGRYMEYPFRMLAPTIVLYPFYLAAFPAIFLLGYFGARTVTPTKQTQPQGAAPTTTTTTK